MANDTYGNLGIGNPGSYGGTNASWLTQDPTQMAQPAAQNQGFFGDLDMKGIGSGLQGLAGVGQVGLGIANYFQNKSNFKDMMNLQLANFDEQKKSAALNASLEQDRLGRRKGGSSSARSRELFDKVATV